MNKYCSNCGFKLSAESKFCSNCGATVEQSQQGNNQHYPNNYNYNAYNNTYEQPTQNSSDYAQYDYQYQDSSSTVAVVSNERVKKKKLFKIIIPIVAVLLVVVIMISVFGSTPSNSSSSGIISSGVDDLYINANYDNSAVDMSKLYSNTVMIFMCGSNLESEGANATNDLNEVINSGIDIQQNNVLVCTGGASKWHNDYVSEDEIAVFELNGESFEKITIYNGLDFCSPSVLYTFLYQGFTEYDTDYYSLIMWDHGGGPVWGYGGDELNDNNSMSIYDIVRAIDLAESECGKKLELFGFDACLMSSVEVASSFSPYTNYFVASEETEPGTGWDYGFLKTLNNEGMNGANIGKEIVTSYSEASKSLNCDLTLGCYDLTKFDDFETEFDNVFSEISSFDDSNFNALARARSNTKALASFSSTMQYDLVDVSDMFSKMSGSIDSSTCLEILDNLTVARYTNVPNTCCMSIYYPNSNLDLAKDILDIIYPTVSFSSSYSRFINNYYNCKIGGKTTVSRSNIPKSNASATANKQKSDFSLKLTDEQLENFSYAKYLIVRKVTADDFNGLGDDTYNFVFGSSDVSLNGDTLEASFNNKALFLKDKKGELTVNPVLAMESDSLDANIVRYHLYGTLCDSDGQKESVPATIQLVLDKSTGKTQILQAVPLDDNDENHTANKDLIDLSDYSCFEALGVCNRFTMDENGNMIDFFDWESSGVFLGVGADYENGDLQVVQAPISNDLKDYYCIFYLYDTYGNTTISELIPFSD